MSLFLFIEHKLGLRLITVPYCKMLNLTSFPAHSSLVGRDEYRGETTTAIIVGVAAAIALRIARTKLLTPGASNAKLLLITGGVFTLISGE